MATLTIKVPESAKSKLAEFVQELGGEILSVSSKDLKKVKQQEDLLNKVREGLREANAIREWKLKSLSMSDLLGGK